MASLVLCVGHHSVCDTALGAVHEQPQKVFILDHCPRPTQIQPTKELVDLIEGCWHSIGLKDMAELLQCDLRGEGMAVMGGLTAARQQRETESISMTDTMSYICI